MKEVEDSSPYIPIPQRVFTTHSGSNNQDYLYTYPPEIEHVGMVKKVEIEKEKATKVNPRQKPQMDTTETVSFYFLLG